MALLICMMGIYPMALWGPGVRFKTQALLGLIPTTVITAISLVRVADFTLVTVMGLDTLCFALLYFDVSVASILGALFACAGLIGSYVRTHGGTSIQGSETVQSYVFRILLILVPILILVLPLRRAIDRIRQKSELHTNLREKLTASIESRKRRIAVAEALQADLDEVVTARTAGLREDAAFLNSFTGAVAHDLRSPMNTLSQFVRYVAEEVHDSEKPESATDIDELSRMTARLSNYLECLIKLAQQLQSEPMFERVDLQSIPHKASGAFSPVQIEGSIVAHTDRELATLALSCLAEGVTGADSNEAIVLRQDQEGIRTIGISESFLNSVENYTKANPAPQSESELPLLAPLALVRICRRLGGWVKIDQSNSAEPMLLFCLEASAASNVALGAA